MKRPRLKETPEVQPTRRLNLFGPPPLIGDEDPATYQKLFDRVQAAVKPEDAIDDVLIADIVQLEWELLRWRRLKTSLIEACRLGALEMFLRQHLGWELYSDRFEDQLLEAIQPLFRGNQADTAKSLAHDYMRDEPAAIDKVHGFLNSRGPSVDDITQQARNLAAQALIKEYARHDSDAVTLIHELLADAAMSSDALLAEAIVKRLDDIERINRLAAIAEGRRNASLREIDRHRIVLGEILRRAVQEVEAEEPKVIDLQPTKRTAAS